MISTLTPLLPHQAAAVAKVAPIKVGALFMEMGTGKSRTAIELAARRQGRIDRVVWFCPVSLKMPIRDEIEKHSAGGGIYVFDAHSRSGDVPTDAFWVVIGIESMSASKRIILAANSIITKKSMVIVDESSYIKGHRAARTDWITRICQRARYRLILTGTPISKGVQDLFSQMRFLSPKILGYESFYAFAANHLEYSERYKGMIVQAHNTDYLAAKMEPYVYQVTKEECLALPEKSYMTEYIDMSEQQKVHYEQAKIEILSQIVDEEFDSYLIFQLFGILQQIVCGFWNWKQDDDTFKLLEFNSERIDALMRIIARIPAQKKVVIWAKYHYDIEQILAALREAYGPDSATVFWGKQSEKARAESVRRFRNEARFFVATPSSGGHGLTLNEAHNVIFYSNSFKYAERLQAEDRTHRIGQECDVTYWDICCLDSIDERIKDNLAGKQDVMDEFKKSVDAAVKSGDKKALITLIKGL